MKVLFVTRKYPPSVGGMELFAFELSNALASKVSLRLVKWGGSGHLRAVVWALPSLFVRAIWTQLNKPADVIHMQDAVLAPLGFILSRCFRKPYVVVVHGLDVTYKNRLFRAVVLPALRRADAVLPISQAAAEAARNEGVDNRKIDVISLAINDVLYATSSRQVLLDELGLGDDSQILLTVGRLVRRKGVAWFISNVLPRLIKQYPKLVYLVIGEGEDRPAIEAAIRESAMGGHVRLLGRVQGELYNAAYNGADVFVMPNINVPNDMEGFGLVLLEAALCARPVVAADTEGIQDAARDGKNAVLVPVQDADAYTAALGAFLGDVAHAREFGDASRRYTLANYSWAAISNRYVQAYSKILR